MLHRAVRGGDQESGGLELEMNAGQLRTQNIAGEKSRDNNLRDSVHW